MKPLDLTKPIQTRDGRPAKFLHRLDNSEACPIVVVIGNPGTEMVLRYSLNGSYASQCIYGDDCLINVPVKHVREYWVNEYPEGTSAFNFLYSSREHADQNVLPTVRRLACKKITIEFFEGEGL